MPVFCVFFAIVHDRGFACAFFHERCPAKSDRQRHWDEARRDQNAHPWADSHNSRFDREIDNRFA